MSQSLGIGRFIQQSPITYSALTPPTARHGNEFKAQASTSHPVQRETSQHSLLMQRTLCLPFKRRAKVRLRFVTQHGVEQFTLSYPPV